MGESREIVRDADARASGNDVVLTNAILDVVDATEKKFVFVIDEWDAPYRLAEGTRSLMRPMRTGRDPSSKTSPSHPRQWQALT